MFSLFYVSRIIQIIKCNTTGHISNFQQDEAVKLVRDGIAAGIFNDMGSGSNVDICIITKDGTTYIRSYDEANVKGKRYV